MANKQRRIVVAGNLNMDIVAVAKSLPGLGEYMYGEQLHFVKGGNGLNVSVAAARVGGIVSMIGFVGDDSFGNELFNFLKGEGVDVNHIRTVKNQRSGTVLFLLTGTEERHVVFPGATWLHR